MKKIIKTVLGFSLLASSALFASEMKMEHSNMKMDMSKASKNAYSEKLKAGRYKVTFSSVKPLTVGKNPMTVMIMRKGKPVTDARLKVKFYMGEEKDMNYMEYKTDANVEGNMYKCDVNIGMGGTWQYHLTFKTSDGRLHKAEGKINF